MYEDAAVLGFDLLLKNPNSLTFSFVCLNFFIADIKIVLGQSFEDISGIISNDFESTKPI